MEIRLKGTGISQTLLAEVGRLADHAFLEPHRVCHDPTAAVVSFFIERSPAPGTPLSGTAQDGTPRIRSKITIRKVTHCQIERYQQSKQTVMIIFGLKIEEDRMYICSAEEDRGQPLFSIDCRVSELDLEIKDE